MMHKQVRVGLTARGASAGPGRARAALLLLAALSLCAGFGCAGGQSGNEGLCGENQRDNRIPDDATLVAESADEDGGEDDDADGGVNQFATDDRPETASGPSSCPPPPDGDEY